jgi:hypothetical protein
VSGVVLAVPATLASSCAHLPVLDAFLTVHPGVAVETAALALLERIRERRNPSS